MRLVKVLNNKIFNLPLDAASYFPKYVKHILDKYLELLKKVDDEYSDIIKKNLPHAELLCSELFDITNFIFKGNAALAYNKFSDVINRLEPHLTYPNKTLVQPNPHYYYKARKVLEGKFELLDMFHVPFEKRYYINTYRFSLPGTPCLYLCNSIYTCWEELDRPFFPQMPVSRYELIGKNFKFLDLTNQIDFVRRTLVPGHGGIPNWETFLREFELPRLINNYPLFSVSFMKVYDRMAHFKPEYIFPQMLMQWIMTKKDLDGVKYLSTKCNSSKFDLHNLEDFSNFAIPIKSFQEKGYCDQMSKQMRLTKPMTWEQFNILHPVKASTPIDYKKDIENKFFGPPVMRIKMENREISDDYLATAFGIMEHELKNMPAKSPLS
ncbi:MAG TPA: hypothetical protein VHE59_03720 [Mucilaginibacter sp.]|nr:hypothetical protein [Mucilaginibacter sp.]